jgi:hypothetical protein
MRQVALLDYDKVAVFIYDLPADMFETKEAIEPFLNSKGHLNFDWFMGNAPIAIVKNGFGSSSF